MMEDKVATDEDRPTVGDVAKKFSVFEDGAYAVRVQEELNAEHYGGNISRRRTVRSDLQVAKSQAEIEAIEAFREEHEIATRNRHLEEKDGEAARKILVEEAERARLEEERDKDIARQLQLKEKEEFLRKKKEREARNLLRSEELARSISREEEEKAKRRQEDESSDAIAALRLTEQETSGTVDIGMADGPETKDDELIARQLQAHEKDKYLIHKKRKEEKRRLKEQERLAMRLQQEETERAKMEAMKTDDQSLSERDGPHENGEGQVRRVEEDDEIYAKQIHRSEVQRAMSPDEERFRREQHDAQIAKKMQHAEVLKAKERHRRQAEREGGRTEERAHRPESDLSPRQDPRGAQRHEPERGDRHDRGRQDPPQVARNPMVNSYPSAQGVPREQQPGAAQIQPIQGQRRSSAKEQEKEKKSRGGLFSKSKKK